MGSVREMAMAWRDPGSLVVAHVLEPCHLAVHHIHLTSLENDLKHVETWQFGHVSSVNAYP